MAYKKYARECDECGKGFNEGYCVDGGSFYYCSDECLHKHYTAEEWEEMCADDGDSYWGRWDEDPDEYMVDEADPAPNKLSVAVLGEHLHPRSLNALFRIQMRDQGLDPDKYEFVNWTITCDVQIKEEDKA
jgi:hypothetical protein